VIEKELFLYCNFLGSYSLLKNLGSSGEEGSKVGFVPSIEFLTPFMYEARLPTNIEPTKIESLVKLGILDHNKIHRVNYMTIAKATHMIES